MTRSATKEATSLYAKKFTGRAANGHFREAHRMLLSSLGIGTYLGQPNEKTDEKSDEKTDKKTDEKTNQHE